jgi:hypothetical protein
VPKYLSPEVLCGRSHVESITIDVESNMTENSSEAPFMLASSAKTDVWSLGLILLEVAMVSTNESLLFSSMVSIADNAICIFMRTTLLCSLLQICMLCY